MKKSIYCGFILVIMMACNIEPEPIDYGADACEYCHMTIVDRQHAAEIVTKKGRAYKFDAIECMMNYMKSMDNAKAGLYLITDYKQLGILIDANKATYLISKEISSPMSAFLSGTSSKEEAEKLQDENGGNLYNWNDLINYFRDTDGVIQ